MTTSPPEPLTYAHYDVISKLGQGAMGVVYLARDQRIGRRVALKLVRPQNIEGIDEAKEFFARLQREAELSGALNHPNIATLYEVGYEKNLISYLAMEYVEGETLHATLKRKEPLPLDRALAIVEDVLEGLAYAHGQGVIHRDIKPANIVVRPDGRAKILDFGIARREESNLTMSGSFVGTPNYMSPEQVKSEVLTPRIDIFSLGIVLYEMLTATKPFAAESMTAVMYNIVQKDPEPVSASRDDVTPYVDIFISRLIAKKPSDRFASAAEALTALRELTRTPPVVGGGAVAAVAPRDERRAWYARNVSNPLSIIVLTLVALPVVLVVGFLTREIERPVPARHSAAQLAEFESKRQSLAHAASLESERKLAEARSAYEKYLRRYPQSVRARDGIARITAAQAALSAAAAPSVRVEVTAEKPSNPKKGEEERAKGGRLESLRKRVRGIFHRKP